jgi:hypothetical protein
VLQRFGKEGVALVRRFKRLLNRRTRSCRSHSAHQRSVLNATEYLALVFLSLPSHP